MRPRVIGDVSIGTVSAEVVYPCGRGKKFMLETSDSGVIAESWLLSAVTAEISRQSSHEPILLSVG